MSNPVCPSCGLRGHRVTLVPLYESDPDHRGERTVRMWHCEVCHRSYPGWEIYREPVATKEDRVSR